MTSSQLPYPIVNNSSIPQITAPTRTSFEAILVADSRTRAVGLGIDCTTGGDADRFEPDNPAGWFGDATLMSNRTNRFTTVTLLYYVKNTERQV